MMPATPIWIRRSMSECSLTVHGMTLSPSAFASASDAAVTSRWLGDHTEQPAAATSRGTEPAKSSMSNPAVHGDAPGRPRCRVSPLPPSRDEKHQQVGDPVERLGRRSAREPEAEKVGGNRERQ